MPKQFYRILFAIFCVVIILFNIFSVLWSQKDKYLAHNYWQNFPSLEKAFLSSQYVSKHPAGWIPDETAFSYAAGKLIKGTNPVLVVVDAPPLGKYLIGISTLIFNNPSTVVAIFGILSIVLLYIVSTQVLGNKLLALLPPLFYSSEPIFKNQFIYTPLLDLFQLVFFLCYFYFIIQALQDQTPQSLKLLSRRKWNLFGNWEFVNFMIASLFLGFFISTKFFVSGVPIIVATFLWTLIHRDFRKMIMHILTIPISIFILLLTYVRVFAFGYALHSFLGIQKYIFLYHQSQIILPFSVWPLLLLNRWYVWFGNKPVISDSQWQITWPIITIISFLTMGVYLWPKVLKTVLQKTKRNTKRNPGLEILMIWSICYLLFLSSGETFSRYLIILLPILYIISTYGLFHVIASFVHQVTRRNNPKKSTQTK